MLYDEHTHDCGCCEGADGCDHSHEDGFSDESAVITMVDSETGEEYEFTLVDDFDYKGESYCVLVTFGDEEPEMVITKVATVDGEEGLMSLEEDEADEVYAEYERLCEEAELLDEDDEESEE